MNIAEDTVVTLDYQLTDDQGKRWDDGAPMVYIHGKSQILPALEEAMDGAAMGEERVVELPPERAYGERMENLVFEAPLSNLPPEIKEHVTEGSVLQTAHEDRKFTLRVLETREKTALVDGNHPLAGRTLTFTVNVVSVREASAEESRSGRILTH